MGQIDPDSAGEYKRRVFRAVAGVAVASVLAATAVVIGLSQAGSASPVDQAEAQLQWIGGLVESFRSETGRYPTTDEGLHAVLFVGLWRDQIKDPWGNQLEYRCPGVLHPESFDLLSYGADRRPGGIGVDADIIYR